MQTLTLIRGMNYFNKNTLISFTNCHLNTCSKIYKLGGSGQDRTADLGVMNPTL